MKRYIIWLILLLLSHTVLAQEKLKLLVKDAATQKPMIGVTVTTGHTSTLATTDTAGLAIITLPAGKHTIHLSYSGYKTADPDVYLPDTTLHEILLEENSEHLDEVTIVASTRNNQGIENSPLKVEVLGKEELGEEAAKDPKGAAAAKLNDLAKTKYSHRVEPPRTLSPGEVYVETECPRGQMGFHVVGRATKENVPLRVRARSSCFCNLSVAGELCKGCLIADVPAIIGSMDIVMGEIDR